VTITAALKDGGLTGTTVLQGPGYSLRYDFHAVRHVESAASNVSAPSIDGSWEIPLESPSAKGEKAFRFIVQQNGAEVAASILRVDGDTGAYSGRYENDKWILSHFDGHRPGVIEVTSAPDGTLAVVVHNEAFKRALEGNESEKKQSGSTSADSSAYAEQRYDGVTKYVAYRSQVARAKGLPAPDNYAKHTTVRDAKRHLLQLAICGLQRRLARLDESQRQSELKALEARRIVTHEQGRCECPVWACLTLQPVASCSKRNSPQVCRYVR
jgi:hypothetical protein